MVRTTLAALALSCALLLAGCPNAGPAAPTAPAPAPATTTTSPAPAAAGDGRVTTAEWCAEHALPESQCIACNPEVEAKWKAMAPQSAAR